MHIFIVIETVIFIVIETVHSSSQMDHEPVTMIVQYF